MLGAQTLRVTYKIIRTNVKCIRLENSIRNNTNGRAYFQRLGDKPLLYRNIGEQLLRAADKYSEFPAFISCHEGKRVTFAEAKHEAEELAIQLGELGVHKGDHVAIWAPNTLQWYITCLASSLGGFPLVCINPAYQAPELQYALQKAKVKVIITMDQYQKQNFNAIIESLLPNHHSRADYVAEKNFPYLKNVIVQTQSDNNLFINYDKLLSKPVSKEQRRYLTEEIVPSIAPEAACNIQFTSGTTGHPKAALLSNLNHVNMGYVMGPYLDMDKGVVRICLALPLFHAFGMGVSMSALHYGAALVSPTATFNGAACLAAIEEEQCTTVMGTPTMFLDMVQAQLNLKKNLSSLRVGMFGGASCTLQTYKSTKEVLGIQSLRIGYGQTECTLATFCQTGEESLEEAANTIGRVCRHLEAKVINDKGETVQFGEPGHLCIRGYCTMMGYYEDEQNTKSTILPGGWVQTGDEITLDANGVGRIMGRKKEMLIRGGENIFPVEIENVLDTHADILESQVIGVPDERLGEEVCAYLRLKPNAKPLTEKDIRIFCQGKVAHFKIPKYVRIIDQYPKTVSGKIQKFKLLELFKQQK